MALTLEVLAIGDTNYISKHNANYTAIKDAIEALQDAAVGSTSALTSFPLFALSVLGASVGRFDDTQVLGTDGGGGDLDISAGNVWVPSAYQVRVGGAATLNLTGESSGTYYTHLSNSGVWSYDSTAVDIVHTIAWSGSAFTTITDPPVLWGNAEYVATKTSTVLGETTYTGLDARMEAAESANSAKHAVTITASDVTLTTDEGLEHAWFNLTGTLTGNRNLIVPDFEKVYIIRNATGGAFDVTVKTNAGTGVVAPQSETSLMLCDGTDVLTFPLLSRQALGAVPMVISAWKNGVTSATERVLGFTVPSGVTGIDLPAGATNSSVEAEVAATAQTDFDLQKNGSSIGTIRFAAAGTVASFVSVSNTQFTGGDLIEVVGPGTPDATLADLYFTLYMTRDHG